MLTESEIAFVLSQGYEPDTVFDGRRLKAEKRRDAARAAGADIVLGAPCREAGHRLRTRAGHCCQCDTAKLAFQERYRAPGFVYIAFSERTELTKVGCAVDIEQRLQNLRNQRYGHTSDWEIVFFTPSAQSGKLESNVHRMLDDYKTHVPYEKDGASQLAIELFRVKPAVAIDALKRAKRL